MTRREKGGTRERATAFDRAIRENRGGVALFERFGIESEVAFAGDFQILRYTYPSITEWSEFGFSGQTLPLAIFF